MGNKKYIGIFSPCTCKKGQCSPIIYVHDMPQSPSPPSKSYPFRSVKFPPPQIAPASLCAGCWHCFAGAGAAPSTRLAHPIPFKSIPHKCLVPFSPLLSVALYFCQHSLKTLLEEIADSRGQLSICCCAKSHFKLSFNHAFLFLTLIFYKIPKSPFICAQVTRRRPIPFNF